MMHGILQAFGLTLALTLAAPAATEDTAATDPAPLFPAAQGDLVLAFDEQDRAPSLLALLTQYADLTGQVLVLGPRHEAETRLILSQSRVPLAAPITVQRDQVQLFVETLIAGEVILSPRPATEPRLLVVHSLRTQAGTWVIDEAIAIRSASEARNHPAVIFKLALELPNSDVRVLANSMRAMLRHQEFQLMLPTSEGILLLCGPGSQLASFAVQLTEIDALQASLQTPLSRELVSLSHASAANLAELLRAARVPGTFEPDPDQNTLLVICRTDAWPGLRELIQRLDVE